MITPIESLLSPVAALRSTISGKVVLPEDDDYNLARLAWDLNADQHPALILFPATAQDVAEGVAFARAQHLGIAIQSTGHGVILPADDCLLILTSPNFFCFAYTLPASYEPTFVHLDKP